MNGELRDRLRRLGVHKGASNLKPAIQRGENLPRHESPISNLQSLTSAPLWHFEEQTAFGIAYVRRAIYPLDHQHGGWTLRNALSHPQSALARINGGVPIDLRDAVFLDTETTGLAGGAGTLVFLVGVGYFTSCAAEEEPSASATDSFVVDQYFLNEPAQEAAMLAALDARINGRQSLVTFNGRGFDVPLLETRYTLSRIAPAFSDLAHLDLLMPARRVWRAELTSCSLSSLEFHMLDVRRDQQDIPGFLIPQLYREYLQTREPAEMQRVMYHNLHDILSMVTLVSRLCNAVDAPANLGEYLAAGQYYESRGQLHEAEETYSAALAALGDGNNLLHQRVLFRMALCLKREERYEQAASYWRRLAESGDPGAWLELAKHYEWRQFDLPQALACARAALALSRERFTRAEVTHRIERLERKLAVNSPG
ncbi:MAG: ribonuclease H-like domain-containing protein [Chloroflexi bacterium]|nr:ribonuclease H-like domain-containing protein [Chloroflexota bacterium]